MSTTAFLFFLLALLLTFFVALYILWRKWKDHQNQLRREHEDRMRLRRVHRRRAEHQAKRHDPLY